MKIITKRELGDEVYCYICGKCLNDAAGKLYKAGCRKYYCETCGSKCHVNTRKRKMQNEPICDN